VSEDSYRKDGIHPKRDWRIFLTSTFIIFSLSALISFYIYVQIDEGGFFAVKEDILPSNVEIDSELLKKTVDEINLREVSLQALKQNKTTVPDPSL